MARILIEPGSDPGACRLLINNKKAPCMPTALDQLN
jgi:hypothetical protein